MCSSYCSTSGSVLFQFLSVVAYRSFSVVYRVVDYCLCDFFDWVGKRARSAGVSSSLIEKVAGDLLAIVGARRSPAIVLFFVFYMVYSFLSYINLCSYLFFVFFMVCYSVYYLFFTMFATEV